MKLEIVAWILKTIIVFVLLSMLGILIFIAMDAYFSQIPAQYKRAEPRIQDIRL